MLSLSSFPSKLYERRGNVFIIKSYNRRVLDAANIRTNTVRMLQKKKEFGKSAAATSLFIAISKPKRNCVRCTNCMKNYEGVTYLCCGHTIICRNCDDNDVKNKIQYCIICLREIKYKIKYMK